MRCLSPHFATATETKQRIKTLENIQIHTDLNFFFCFIKEKFQDE